MSWSQDFLVGTGNGGAGGINGIPEAKLCDK